MNGNATRKPRNPSILKFAGVSALLALTLMCSRSEHAATSGTTAPAGPTSADHWTSLFDGKSLTGWEPAGHAAWSVQNGAIVGVQGENNAPGDLFTSASYSDFELSVTYRAEWPANSGVWFRYQSPEIGYQADILEWKDPVAFSGTLYCSGKMFIARNTDKSLENRDGWNTVVIRAEGDHVQIWLNGHQTADVHDESARTGKIGFQVHPGAEFAAMKIVVKEVKIKRL